MLIWPDCIPCILRMSLGVARLAIRDDEGMRGFLQEVLRLSPLKGEDWNVTSPEVIRDVWTIMQQLSGETDPLKGIKEEQNRQALELLPLAREQVLGSHDPLEEAVKFAIAANSIDAMINPREATEGIFEILQGHGIDPLEMRQFEERLRRARTVVYLGDNCGEIVFDRLLIETIRDRYELDVVFVTRTLSVLNDATLQDATSVGMGEVAAVAENGIPEPLPGTVLQKASPELKALMEEGDLIISKGGGNYDSLTEEEGLKGKVTFLFQAKCHPYCTLHRSPLGGLVLYNY